MLCQDLRVGCWTHARRVGTGRSGSADIALGYIIRLYKIENSAVKIGRFPEKVYEVSQERANPSLRK